MINVIGITKEMEVVQSLDLNQLSNPELAWYWVDFSAPTNDEVNRLRDHFNFHPLAVEDCIHYLQRPKVDYYDGYNFYVFRALNQQSFDSEELDLFMGDNYIITFHFHHIEEVEIVWRRLISHDPSLKKPDHWFIFYQILDKMVDQYFPSVYKIEDQLDEIENYERSRRSAVMDDVFEIRSDLLSLRRMIFPMRDLLYQMMNSSHVMIPKSHRAYFADVQDHLLRLTEMIESNREMTADIRDNYMSLNSNRMNMIMMTLTIITTIFMPMTFIAGIYGMNFDYMPELRWRWGYFGVLGVMALVGMTMVIWFRKKGWLSQDD